MPLIPEGMLGVKPDFSGLAGQRRDVNKPTKKLLTGLKKHVRGRRRRGGSIADWILSATLPPTQK